MYDCALCDKQFSRIYNMQRHLSNTHGFNNLNSTENAFHTSGGSDHPIGYNEGGEHSEEEDVESCSTSDEYEKDDIFSKEDADEESDVTITSSEDDDDAEEIEPREETTLLKWPSNTHFLRALWIKYGDGKFKLIKHHNWLEDFRGRSVSSSLRKVRHANEGEFESLCEIAKNILKCNVYTHIANRHFIFKNKNLIRALGNSKVSLERKKKLVIERGGFASRLVELIEPLLDDMTYTDTSCTSESEGEEDDEYTSGSGDEEEETMTGGGNPPLKRIKR